MLNITLLTGFVIVASIVALIAYDVWATLQSPYHTISHVWQVWSDRWPILVWAYFGLGAHLTLARPQAIMEQIGYTRIEGIVFLVWLAWLILILSLSGVAQRLTPWAWALLGVLTWWLLWPQRPLD
jgi:hypothetical protein